MNAVAQRKERELAVARELVVLFDQSGVEYTCDAAITGVVDAPAVKLAGVMDRLAPAKLATRPAQCVRKACDLIYARKYP